MIKDASFDGYDLQNSNIILTKIDHDTIPSQELKRYRIVRGDGEIITDKRFGAKRILLIGRVQGTSSDDLESRLDVLRSKLVGASKINKILSIDYNGTQRVYTATCVGLTVDRRNGTVNFADIQIEFISTFGEDATSSTILTSTSQTISPNPKAITVLGSAERQKVTVTVLLNTFTGSFGTITIQDNLSQYALSVSRIWVAGDILVIDSKNFSVKVNGLEVDFSGAFPDFIPGAGSIIYSDDFTARNINLTVTQTARYL